MSLPRRKFIQEAASFSALGVATPGLLGNGTRGLDPATGSDVPGFQPDLMPSQKEVWEWETWMGKLGPKPTGNAAHKTYIDWLDKQFQSCGLKTFRETVKLPQLRWEATRTELTVNPNDGQSLKATVLSSFPYSGDTSAQGVTGEVVYAGASPTFDFDGLKGKIALVAFSQEPRAFWKLWHPWGTAPRDMVVPATVAAARAGFPRGTLEEFKRAGAIGVIFMWTDVSDGNAAYQYSPWSDPYGGIPALFVGRGTGERLRSMALGHGGKATLVLEADKDFDATTDHLIAALPGANASDSDEIIIINSHTDGTNAVEENGGIALVALAKYFSKIPQSQRKRTFMFIAETGHFRLSQMPTIDYVLEKHPDYVDRAVAACTIEHLGAMEWEDDATLTNYQPTGRPQLGNTYAPLRWHGEVLVNAFQDSGSRMLVCRPTGGITGEGSGLIKAGVPEFGTITIPNYLAAAYPDGGLEKVDGELMYRQIQGFAKAIHVVDART